MSRQQRPILIVLLGFLAGVAIFAAGQDECFEDVVVSGAGAPEANGRYEMTRWIYDRPWFYLGGAQGGTVSNLFYSANIGAWVLNVYGNGYFVGNYWNESDAMTPPSSGWQCNAPPQAPTQSSPPFPPPMLSGGELCAPEVGLNKDVPLEGYQVGDTITYTFDVTNTGEVTLFDVILKDVTLDLDVPLSVSQLLPGESATGTLDVPLTQEDLDSGELANRADVNAISAAGVAATASDSVTLTFIRSPELTLAKSAYEGPYHEGDIARFAVLLTNTGNVTLEDLSAQDTSMGVDVALAVSSLSPGASTQATVEYVVTAEDVERGTFMNSSSAEGTAPNGDIVRAEAQATILCVATVEDLPLPEIVDIDVAVRESSLFQGKSELPVGRRPVRQTFCQGEPLEIVVSVRDGLGASVESASVYVSLLAISLDATGESSETLLSQKTVLHEEAYEHSFDTVPLEAGLYDVRIWIPEQDKQWVRVNLIACGDNADGDLVSDAVDACPTVAGSAANAGCPRGDLDHSGIPDYMECASNVLVDEAYPIRLVLESSSEWASVSLTDGRMLLTSVEREGKPSKSPSGLTEMQLFKICCTNNTVRAVYEAYVFDVAPAEMTWTIEKGGLGRVALEVYAYPEEANPEDDYQLLERFAHNTSTDLDHPPGSRTFGQSSALLRETVEPVSLSASCLKPDVEPWVLALYSLEYATPDGPQGEWRGWKSGRVRFGAFHDVLGDPYDSQDAKTLSRHVEQARQAGIDALICTWPGRGTPEDVALALLLDAAQAVGLRIGVYYEGWDRSLSEDGAYLYQTHGSHPAFLRVDQRPVIFVGHNQQRSVKWAGTLEALRALEVDFFAVMDGIDLSAPATLDGFVFNPLQLNWGESFEPSEVDEKLERAGLLAAVLGSSYVATVYPGGLAYSPNGEAHEIGRDDGLTYDVAWEWAIASNADWILIRSFNLWLDGTQIEPSKQHASAYLEQTARWASAWKTDP